MEAPAEASLTRSRGNLQQFGIAAAAAGCDFDRVESEGGALGYIGVDLGVTPGGDDGRQAVDGDGRRSLVGTECAAEDQQSAAALESRSREPRDLRCLGAGGERCSGAEGE